MRPAWIEVDLAAICANVRLVRDYVGKATEVIAVVKANGYGHGLVFASRAALLAGASALGVALLEEALSLREAGIESPLLVLGCGLPENAPDLVRNSISQVVSDAAMASALSREAVKQGRQAGVHLKVDTGMGRVGCPPEDLAGLFSQVRALPGVRLDGIATHFPDSDPHGRPAIEAQLARFLGLLSGVDPTHIPCRHAASSAATLLCPAARLDAVRVGLLAYGIPPFDGPCPVGVLPALALKARIVQVNQVPAGKAVSYGGTYVADRPSRLALVPVGYADGYPRRLSNRGHVLVRGLRCPIRGRICMDQCVVDVTALPAVSVGEEVVLIGAQGGERITVGDLTLAIDGTPHEVVACLGPRLPRVYLDGKG